MPLHLLVLLPRLSSTPPSCCSTYFRYARQSYLRCRSTNVTRMSSTVAGMATAGQQERRVAVVGGGIGGLAAAQELARRGLAPTVFDMGTRGPGGRTSTRCERDGSGRQFDHGAQFFRAQGPAFRRQVGAWVDAGVAAPWRGRFGVLDADAPGGPAFIPVDSSSSSSSTNMHAAATAAAAAAAEEGPGFCELLEAARRGEDVYVGVPGMDALCAHLARSPLGAASPTDGSAAAVATEWGTRVQRLERSAGGRGWQLWGVRVEGGGGGGLAAATPATAATTASAAEQQQQQQQGEAERERRRSAPAQRAQQQLLGEFDAVVLSDAMFAHPSSPGHVALPPGDADLGAAAEAVCGVQPQSVFVAMLTLPVDLADVPFSAACVRGGAGGGGVPGGELQFISCDSSKPLRPVRAGETDWVAVASAPYSAAILERFPLVRPGGAGHHNPQQTREYQEAVLPLLVEPALRLLRAVLPAGKEAALLAPLHARAHRWGRAFQANPLPQILSSGGVVMCGDYVGGGSRLEAVVASGRAAAEEVARQLEA